MDSPLTGTFAIQKSAKFAILFAAACMTLVSAAFIVIALREPEFAIRLQSFGLAVFFGMLAILFICLAFTKRDTLEISGYGLRVNSNEWLPWSEMGPLELNRWTNTLSVRDNLGRRKVRIDRNLEQFEKVVTHIARKAPQPRSTVAGYDPEARAARVIAACIFFYWSYALLLFLRNGEWYLINSFLVLTGVLGAVICMALVVRTPDRVRLEQDSVRHDFKHKAGSIPYTSIDSVSLTPNERKNGLRVKLRLKDGSEVVLPISRHHPLELYCKLNARIEAGSAGMSGRAQLQ